MSNPAKELFDSIKTMQDLEAMIHEGETEGQYLEAKAPSTPYLTKSQKVYISQAVSGFSNSGGGIIIWGVSTTKHSHGNIDVLSQVESIASCSSFAKQLAKEMLLSTHPSIRNVEIKTIKQKPSDSRGVVISYIPPTPSDPVMSVADNNFYIHTSDEFTAMPYDILNRMFTGWQSPNLSPIVRIGLIQYHESSTQWDIPIGIQNHSTTFAQNVYLTVSVDNPEAVSSFAAERQFSNTSDINKEKYHFTFVLDDGGIHKGINLIIGKLFVKMKGRHLNLILNVNIFANQMKAKKFIVKIKLVKNEPSAKLLHQEYLY